MTADPLRPVETDQEPWSCNVAHFVDGRPVPCPDDKRAHIVQEHEHVWGPLLHPPETDEEPYPDWVWCPRCGCPHMDYTDEPCVSCGCDMPYQNQKRRHLSGYIAAACILALLVVIAIAAGARK